MPGTVIESRGLTRRFAGLTALNNVDVTVSAGEAVAVLGPNGAGKTTFLRILATLLRPSSGALSLFGHPVGDGSARARRRIGFLSHQSFLYPDLTPMENLHFYGRMFRVPALAERLPALLAQVGLVGWAHRPVRTLSRGLEQRCALARALLHAPELLLLDEPFTGLDVDGAGTLSDILRQTHAAGTTLLMTTHELHRAVDICQRAVILVHGRVAWDASIAGLQSAAFERIYGEVTHSA
jgi:heme exporter protein A